MVGGPPVVRRPVRRERGGLPGDPPTVLGHDLGHAFVEVHEDVRADQVRELGTYEGFDDGIPVEDRAGGVKLRRIDGGSAGGPTTERDAQQGPSVKGEPREHPPRPGVAPEDRPPAVAHLPGGVDRGVRHGRARAARPCPERIVVYGLTLGGAYLLAWGACDGRPRADPVLLPIAGMLEGSGSRRSTGCCPWTSRTSRRCGCCSGWRRSP